MDGVFAAAELLTFFVIGDHDDFQKYMHTKAMPFGVAVNAVMGAIAGCCLDLAFRRLPPFARPPGRSS